jgi:hypothetical protein
MRMYPSRKLCGVGVGGGCGTVAFMPMSDEPKVLSEAESRCPRCGQAMESGFLNAGKGPFRWVTTVRENATILGGEKLVRQHPFWGRHVIPAARCSACRFGVFTYPGGDTFGPE